MSDPEPKRRRASADPRLPVPKHAVAIGIVVGGVLGVLLGSITLYYLRTPAQEPADLAPIRAVAPRASPTASSPATP